MRAVVFTIGTLIALLGAVGIVAPTFLLSVSRPFLTPTGLYAAALIRVVFGAVLLMAAPGSRLPRTLRVLGAVIVVAGIATPLVGVERARAIVDWWAAHGPVLLRMWASVAVVLGAFVAYAVSGRR
jgi:hypothetical protein